MKVQSSEKGQALILIILAIVAIFGFAALAVDGGRIYSERRRAQAAVDSAALGAAYAAAEGKVFSQVKSKALSLAAQNGYANLVSEKSLPLDERSVVVEYFNPPQTGPYKDNALYHQVRITERVNPIFSQIVNGGETRIVVEAVTFSTVNCNCFAAGNAIHASHPSASKALEFDGGVQVTVKRGNIFSNSSSSTSGVKNGGSGKITVENGKIWVVGEWSGKTNTSPAPIEGAPPSPLPNIPVPDCDSAPAGSIVSTGKKGGSKMTPGRYDTDPKINGGNWTLDPGMYCFNNGFTVNGNATISGNGVFIAMMGGELKLNGNGEVHLTRANDLKDGKGNQWGGMLVYAPTNNHDGISLSGTNNTSYSGTVLAPGAECKLGGNSVTMGVNANIICDTIKIHGNATVILDYVPEQNYQLPPMIELTQ